MRTSQQNSGPVGDEDKETAEAGRCHRCVSVVSALLEDIMVCWCPWRAGVRDVLARTGCSWVFLCVWCAAACLGVLAIAIIGYKWC